MQQRTIVLLVLALVTLLCLGLAMKSCSDARTAATREKLATEKGEAAIDSGAEAANITSVLIANDTATDDIVAGGINEIRNAPEADRGLAAQRAACRLRSHRDSERCAALRAADTAANAQAR